MRFGAHVYLWTEHWTRDPARLFGHAAELGLEWVEVSVGEDVTFDGLAVRRAAQAAGLEVAASPGGLWPMERDLSLADPDLRRDALAWHLRFLQDTADLGGMAYTGALYGHPGNVPRRFPTEEEYRWMAEGVHALAQRGAELGVRVALEPMSHFRTYLVNRPQQVMQLIALADHPNLGVLMDTYHLVTEVRDYAAALRTVAPRLWGLHACESDRGVPGGGLVPWAQVFGALQEIGFDGYVGMESYTSGPERLAERRGLFSDICPDGDAFARRGLAFLKGCMVAH